MWYLRKQNKYHAKTHEYNGQVYHSIKEAQYAQELDLRKKAKEITMWERQVRIPLDVNGYHICNYIADFLVTFPDTHIEIHEVKGFMTEIARIKLKLVEALYQDKYKLIVIT